MMMMVVVAMVVVVVVVVMMMMTMMVMVMVMIHFTFLSLALLLVPLSHSLPSYFPSLSLLRGILHFYHENNPIEPRSRKVSTNHSSPEHQSLVNYVFVLRILFSVK